MLNSCFDFSETHAENISTSLLTHNSKFRYGHIENVMLQPTFVLCHFSLPTVSNLRNALGDVPVICLNRREK